MSGKLALGYVWEEDGKIIGNATLLTTRTNGRFLVVNVAVHPDHRRRGIARDLMAAIIQLVREKNGHEILLQVEKANDAAIHLYQSLRFQTIGHMTTWYTAVSRLRELEPGIDMDIRELPRHNWEEAYRLDTAALPPNLNWPEPLPHDAYKLHYWRRLENFLNGRHAEAWTTTDEAHQLTGVAGIWGEWGRPYHVTLRVHPSWQGQMERPLLAKIIRRLYTLSRRNVRLDHPDDDQLMTELLREANFQPRRTLTHMHLNIS